MKKSEVKQIIYDLIRKHNRFPVASEISDILSISKVQVRQLFNILVDDHFLIIKDDWYDLAPDNETIFPIKKPTINGSISGSLSKDAHQNAPIPENTQQNNTNLPLKEETVISPTPKEKYYQSIIKKLKVFNDIVTQIKLPVIKKNVSTNSNFSTSIKIIQRSMALIGMGAAIISIYYTIVWMKEFLPFPFAVILSSIIVGFSIMAFELIIVFISGKITVHWSRWFIALLFVILWFIVEAFSITSTIAGQYNQFAKNQLVNAEENQSTNISKIQWNNIQEHKQEITQRIKEQRERRIQIAGIVKGISSVTNQEAHASTFSNAQWRIQQIDSAIEKLNIEMDSVRAEEKEIIKKGTDISKVTQNVSNIPDFYSWLAKLFKISKDIVQFLCSLFPAVFVDIISPVGIAVALFLKNKED